MASKAPSFRSDPARPRARRDAAHALADAIPLAALILDRELRVEKVNDRYCELFRVDAAGSLGCSVYALAEGLWATPRIRALLDAAVLGPCAASLSLERDVPGLGGRLLRVHVSSLTRMPGPGAARVIFAVDDVTDAARAAAAGRATASAEDPASAESLARLSHQLRGHLGAIANWLHLLSTGTPDAALQRQGLEAIEQALKGQTRIVDELDADLARKR